MTRNMVMELSYGLQATCMLASTDKMKGMAKEKWLGLMGQSTLVTGSEAFNMVKERWSFLMDQRNVGILRTTSIEARNLQLFG